jgi:hypothetical protein
MCKFRALLITAAAVLDPAICVAATNEPLKDIHTVGIVSALGNDIIVQNRGVSVFTNSQEPMTLDWTLDDDVAQRIATAIKGRLDIKPVSVDLAQAREKALKSNPSFSDIGDYVAGLRPSNDVDAYIVVLPVAHTSNEIYGLTATNGLGINRYESAFFASHQPVTIFATYVVAVVDAKSRKPLVWSYGKLSEDSPHSGPIEKFCSSSLRAATPADVTDGQKAAIRQELEYMILTSLPNALKLIGLPPASDISGNIPSEPEVCTNLHATLGSP